MRTRNVKNTSSEERSSSILDKGTELMVRHQHFHQLKTITPTIPSEIKTLRAFSNSRLEGISECPTFGVVHMQRQYPQHARAMALEAGEAMHQFFAAMRVWQLHSMQKLRDHAEVTGNRIFNEVRWGEI